MLFPFSQIYMCYKVDKKSSSRFRLSKKYGLLLYGNWHSVKFLDRRLFLQPLKLATSNVVHNLGSGTSLPKTTFMTIIVKGLD